MARTLRARAIGAAYDHPLSAQALRAWPSSVCSGRLAPRASSRDLPPLIRSPVSQTERPMTAFERVYQFKVSLQGIEPQVWRRIQVPESYSFWDLHVAIQDAMGWKDYHLHLFRVSNPETPGQIDNIGIPDDEGWDDSLNTLPGWNLSIADYFTRPNMTVQYEYDFGDDWQHEVVLEEILPRQEGAEYPLCLAGAQACPPEDCGGVHGFERVLEAMRNPDHEEHQETVDWIGTEYDPNAFHPENVRFDDPQQRWDFAFGSE